ncbi:hypothetical protein E0L36_17740 [Streptomyces sp. AJS327]|uniref:hypothetical protein n=1 Tax=Streptomyces sp. AJS327 TaxID=2545265 RepID=UPI0015DF742F|nr:hypothetical protein [Streptomyces sp. AJS327]MBA0052659.1 hypothetical protein [Streptomyces sp. AJS327]
MTDENPPPLFTPAPRAPWREVLRHRWSAPSDSALVLRDVDGQFHLLWAGAQRHDGGSASATPPGTVEAAAGPPRVRHPYEAAFRVNVAHHANARALRVPHQYGPPEPVSLRVSWWVHDPVQVVRTHTTHGWSVVRRDLDRRLRDLERTWAANEQSLGADELAHHLATARTLDHYGLAYAVTDTSSREVDDELLLSGQDTGSFPFTWNVTRREEYDFCVQAVRSGPVALAALWLLRQPDQVSAVLDWSVGHRDLISEEVGWEEEMVGLLGHLSSEERHELSKLLRDRLLTLGRGVPGDQGVTW